VVAVTQAAYRVLPVRETHPERMVFVYDLAALTAETGEQHFPAKLLTGPHGVVPEDLGPEQIRARFQYQTILPLYPGGDWARSFRDERLARAEATALRGAWREAVLENPGDYAGVRLRFVESLLGLKLRPRDAFEGIAVPGNFGHPIEFPRAYLRAADFIETFAGEDPWVGLDLAWLYVLLATACAIYVRLRSPELGGLAVVLAAAVWTHLAAVGLAAQINYFRYVNLVIPVALVLAVFAVRARPRVRRAV